MVNYVVPGPAGVKEHGHGFSPLDPARALLANNDATIAGQAQSPRAHGRGGSGDKRERLKNRPAPATQSMDNVDLRRMSREERVRVMAALVAELLPEMFDVCSQCSVQSFEAMKIVIWPKKVEDYDKSYLPETLAAYKYEQHTTFLFDHYFKAGNVLQASTLFHEYLHSFPDNHETWKQGNQNQRDGNHTERPWETEPIRLENLFTERFRSRIVARVGLR